MTLVTTGGCGPGQLGARTVVGLVAGAGLLGLASAVQLGDGGGLPVLLAVGAGVALGVAMPQVIVWRRQRAILHREREQSNGLFRASLEASASMGEEEVEDAITRWARVLLDCTGARISRLPPDPGELGTRLRSPIDPDRWLIVSDRSVGSGFDVDDERLLERLVAATAAAMDNAYLYQRAQDEGRKLANVVDSSSDGIFSVGPDGLVVSWNPAMEGITGLAAAQAIGEPAAVVFDAHDAEGDPIELPLDDAPPGPREGMAVQLRGRPAPLMAGDPSEGLRWLDCTWSPMDEGGYVVVARDVSGQYEVEHLKADFLATVSHELRTPLTPIQGFLQTLLRDDAAFPEDERKRFYEVMLRQSERLERLIRDLLDATTLQEHVHLIAPENVEWGDSAAKVVELFHRQYPTRQFRLTTGHDLPPAFADEQRAEQVLSNLLANAVKYSPDGTPIDITIDVHGDRVTTEVADYGPGVPPADRERVFERFTRLGDHLTRTVGGAGLGLFIARRLLEAMGGDITVGEARSGGAAFRFTLPVADVPARQVLDIRSA